MRIVTWNVNGLRARAADVLKVWRKLEPTVLCLQETKCRPDQVPVAVAEIPGTLQHFNGAPKGYSGTGLLVRRDALATEPLIETPPFDDEARAQALHIGPRTLLNLYMPYGGKDYPAKLRFYDALIDYAEVAIAAGRPLCVSGDMNVCHTDRDIHPRELREADIGVRDDERERVDRLLALGLRDTYREAYPDASDHFTWWAYWGGHRSQNRGRRLDYHLVSPDFGEVIETSISQIETGSDHAPLVADIEVSPPG